MKNDITIVILAAGNGKRMNSQYPKPLHTIAGKALISHVLIAGNKLNPEKIVIVSQKKHKELFEKQIPKEIKVNWATQEEPRGTADALFCALNLIQTKNTLVLLGDVPLINIEDLHKLVKNCSNDSLGLITAKTQNPNGLGRIVRDNKNQIIKIIEQNNCCAETAKIQEINTGIMHIPSEFLHKNIKKISRQEDKQEFYLTDCVELWKESKNKNIISVIAAEFSFFQGINTMEQLSQVENFFQKKQAQKLLLEGVFIKDPSRFDLRGNLKCQKDVHIDINCIFEKNVFIGENSSIGANCILENVTIGKNCKILPNSILKNTIIKDNVNIGPFAYCREETIVENNAKIGCFVESKKTHLGENSKASHLSYLGDLDIKENVNIGAGVIHCNYDGVKKHRSVIKKEAFIGANSQLIAPIVIGEKATIGAGSCISKNAPENELTLSRAPQKTIYNWKKKNKKEEESLDVI